MGLYSIWRWGLCLLLASAGLRAQSLTGAFFSHQIRITSRDTCNVSTPYVAPSSQSSFSFPITATCGGASISGQIQLDYPAAPPTGTLSPASGLLTFAAPLATAINFSGKLTAPDATFRLSTSIVTGNDPIVPDHVGDRCPEPSTPGTTVPVGVSDFSGGRSCKQSVVPTGASEGGNRVVALRYKVYITLSSARASAAFYAEISSYYLIAAAAVDLSVNHFEVVQVVQDPDNNVPLIAGRATVARVFVDLGPSTPAPLAAVTGLLHGFRDDIELAGSPLKPVAGPISAPRPPSHARLGDTLNFRLPADWTTAGSLRLVAEVLPPDGVNLSSTSHNILPKNFVFKLAPNLPASFYVYYWSMCYQPPGAADPVCPSGNIGLADTFLGKLYPLPDNGVQYLRWNIPQKTWRQPLVMDTDMNKLIASFRKFYDMADLSMGGADQLAVWMPPFTLQRSNPPPGQSPTFTLLGTSDPKWISQSNSARVVYAADTIATSGLLDAAHTLAHEIGHNLGLRHTNTPDSCNAWDSHSDWNYRDATIQAAGLDPQTMEVKPSTKFDLMSYCSRPGSNIWISPFHFGQLFSSQALAASPAPAAAVKRPARSAVAAEYLIISGSAQRDGSAGRLDPGYRVTSSTPGPPPDPAGNHCLRMTDAGGGATDYCFTLAFESEPSGDPIDQESFSLKVPYVAGAARVSLLRGGTELAALTTSGNPPNLTILTPQPGDTWTGTQTITWSAFDPDGNALIYSVLYSADGGNSWLPVDLDMTDTQYSFDTAEIRAGSQVYFRVLASSSVNTASATVGPVTILPAARIQASPASLDFGALLAGQTSNQELVLLNRGNAPLSVKSLTVDKQAFSVTGPTLPVTIAPGARQIVGVRFTAGPSPGAQTAKLTILSDDRDGAAPAIALIAFIAATLNPQIAVTPGSLDFGSVPAKTAKDLALTVSNSGGAPLTVNSIISANPQFSVTAPAVPFTLAPGAQQSVTVRFTANAAGTQTGALTIASDDPARSTATVSLTGAVPQANPIPGPAPSVLFSDSFHRADADRCALGAADLALGGSGSYYYLPMFGVSNPVGANIVAGALQNNGKGYGGVEFVPAAGACSSYSRASNIGQDVDIQVDLLVPSDAAGHITDAGPFFRARAAARGDGYFGGENAGYWVQLYSTGEVKVKNLNTTAVLAARPAPAGFDATIVHKIEISARGAILQVAVDGQLVAFTQSGGATTSLSIPTTAGSNDGAAGIAFGADLNSGLIGGQRASNLVVSVYR